MYEFLSYEILEDGIAAITLRRPESLNAIHLPLLEEIYAAADEAAEDPRVAVLVYRGEGRAFSVGRDFKYSGDLQANDPEGWYAWRKRYKDFGPQTWSHPKATIAQVQGYALGGGHNLAVGCDITVASDEARFGYPEARFGLLHGDAHVWNWLIGPKKTKEYMFTGRNFSAQEAYSVGLINHAVSSDELEETVIGIARDIVALERRNPGYIRANKYLINERHIELLEYSSWNPNRGAAKASIVEYTMHSKESQERFYGSVTSEGIHAALNDLHGGFQSRD